MLSNRLFWTKIKCLYLVNISENRGIHTYSTNHTLRTCSRDGFSVKITEIFSLQLEKHRKNTSHFLTFFRETPKVFDPFLCIAEFS